MDKGTPYQSCLEPFEAEIIALRDKRRPVSCAKIAAYLKEKHQISITRQAIQKFLKVRAKGFKPCRYAESIKRAIAANQSTTEVPPVSAKPRTAVSEVPEKAQKQAVTETSKTATPKASGIDDWENEPFEMEFSETYNLTRLPPEEAERRNKIIEQKIWEKWHKNKKPKEKQ